MVIWGSTCLKCKLNNAHRIQMEMFVMGFPRDRGAGCEGGGGPHTLKYLN